MDGCLPLQLLSELFGRIGPILNSAFVSAFLSALAGAGLGVWGAQKLATRTARKAEMLKALAQANSMTVLACIVTNEAISLKKQHILSTCDSYFAARESFIKAQERLIGGAQQEKPLTLCANFIFIPPPTIPVEALKNLAYSMQHMPGRGIALVAAIDQYCLLLSHSVADRTEQIKRFKSDKLQGEKLANAYFGLASKGENDSTYHDTMRAIQIYTDDVAFFGAELVEELEAYTARLCESLKAISDDIPKRTTADFSAVRTSGLFPPRENYESWLSGFPRAERKSN